MSQTKQDAGYHGSSVALQFCAGCTHFNTDNNRCEIVEGWVGPLGWCKHWSSNATGKTTVYGQLAASSGPSVQRQG